MRIILDIQPNYVGNAQFYMILSNLGRTYFLPSSSSFNMKYSIFDFGIIYDIILLMLFIAPVIDLIGLKKFAGMTEQEKKEYNEELVNPLKLLMYAAAAAYCIYFVLTQGYDSVTNGIHIFIGVLLIVDLVIYTVIKIRYR